MSALQGLVERGLVTPDWAEALAPVDDRIAEMGRFLRAEVAAGHGYLPAGDQILRAFSRPLAEVRVLVVGQDPYPTPGHPIGLSFAVAGDVRPLPRSLVNIFRELVNDTGVAPPTSGDLGPWQEQGVMLLNRVLTVRPGDSASHRGKGWEEVTDCAIGALARRGGPAVAILWGRDAQSLAGSLGPVPWVGSAHPSPCRPPRASSAPGPSARPTSCWPIRAPHPLTGPSPDRALVSTSTPPTGHLCAPPPRRPGTPARPPTPAAGGPVALNRPVSA